VAVPVQVNHMSREKNLIKNSAILSLGTVFPKFMSVIMLPIITACLTKTEYGTYDLITTLVSLFLPIATLQMQASAFRFLIKVRGDREQQKKIISNIVCFTVPVCVAALTVLFFCLGNVQWGIRLLIVGYFFTDTILITVRQIARGLGKNHIYSISALTNSGIELVMVAVLLLRFGRGLDGVLWALIVSQTVSILYILGATGLVRYIDFHTVSKEQLKALIAYSWPLIPNALSSWVVRVSDRLVLTYFMGLEATAVYAVANKLPSMFSVIQSTFSLAWQENAAESVDDRDSGEYYGKMFHQIYNIMIGVMALLIAFTPVIFAVLIRGDYDESYNHMSILYIGVLFSTISSYLGGIYIAHMKSKEIGITTCIAAGINLAINLIFVKSIGIYAASISTAVCYIWLSFFRMHDIQKFQKINFNYKRIISLFLVLCVMSLICAQRMIWLDLLNMIAAVILAIVLNKDILGAVIKLAKKKFLKK
jgi:O-antigen/teichoic acid export membrane protein